MEVRCETEEVDLENEEGREQPSVRVTCTRCNRAVESFGTSSASLRRCAVLLRDACPLGERNFYIVEAP